jgi:GGDEF domain-containing protein
LDYSANLGQTYLNLAKAYKHLNKLDDAYNSYWQCKEHAEKYQIPIFTALANLGLGQILSIQGKFEQSNAVLLDASNTLSNEQLMGPYLDVLIELSISARNLNQLEDSNKWLTAAQKITEDYSPTVDQIKLYELLSTMYYEQKLFKLSTIFQKKYIEAYKKFNSGSTMFQASKYTPDIDVINNRDLVLKLSDESDLGFNYAAKFKKQETVIFLLSILLIVFGCIACLWFFRRAKLKSHFEYMNMEANQHNIASPSYTKQLYLFTFKMARKYNYPLTIAYIVVENWNELVFHFDKKTVREAEKTLSALLQECVSEFDHAGKINDGEYILMCPHQSNEIILKDLEKLADALKVRFFANIGDFSIKIKYSCDMPVVQDIDPYLFLSRLSENHLTSIQKK